MTIDNAYPVIAFIASVAVLTALAVYFGFPRWVNYKIKSIKKEDGEL